MQHGQGRAANVEKVKPAARRVRMDLEEGGRGACWLALLSDLLCVSKALAALTKVLAALTKALAALTKALAALIKALATLTQALATLTKHAARLSMPEKSSPKAVKFPTSWQRRSVFKLRSRTRPVGCPVGCRGEGCPGGAAGRRPAMASAAEAKAGMVFLGNRNLSTSSVSPLGPARFRLRSSSVKVAPWRRSALAKTRNPRAPSPQPARPKWTRTGKACACPQGGTKGGWGQPLVAGGKRKALAGANKSLAGSKY